MILIAFNPESRLYQLVGAPGYCRRWYIYAHSCNSAFRESSKPFICHYVPSCCEDITVAARLLTKLTFLEIVASANLFFTLR